MLPPIYYETCTEAVSAAYARLEDAILEAMVRRILKMGFVSESTKQQAEVLQEAGMLYNDILQIIAQRSNICMEQVQKLFEDAGATAIEIDNTAAKQAELSPVNIRQSDSLWQVLEAGFKKTMGVMDNLTKTTAKTTQRAFYKACNDAYMQISSGAFSYQEAIRNVLKQAAQDGLSVEYPSGHVDKLDVAIRRAALTGVGQTAAEVSKTNAEENGCYLMEITAHSGARPEHAKWQGQLVSLTGKDVGKTIDGLKVWSLSGIGYGSGDGFRGWNCRHDWYPYYVGYSTPNYTKKELEKLNEKNVEWNGEKYTEYEISQMQRAGERKIRKLKRQTMSMQQAAELTDNPELKAAATADYQAMAANLKTAEKNLKEFCKATGQDRDRFREQVMGFGRSESQKAVHAAKRQQTANQTAGNVPSGHAVEVTPPTKKDNSSTGKTYQAKKNSGKALTSSDDGGIIEEIKKTGIKFQDAHIPPQEIDVSLLSIDTQHIDDRKHDVSLKEAVSFVKNAEISISRWGGQFENYYSKSGAAYVNVKTNIIRTAFRSNEYDDHTKEMMEVLEKWKKK